ncbi:MAG: uroporphyrinogen-III synthase [Betaproteobacteria bacterium]|nr:MAG: uroporphyrinogen-III synthase [Betaproteobacteria bacterium]
MSVGIPGLEPESQSPFRPGEAGQSLAGRHVVVTRPAAQAGHLAAAVKLAGGVAVLFPVLTIHDIDDPRPLLDIAERLDDFDLAVFVSPNAVRKALTVILGQRRWPTRLRVATMGQTSERELASFGVVDIIAPHQRFDSEALLELPQLQQMTGKKVLVFRGDSGRDLLGDTLTRRGATVEYLACYRRGRPDVDIAPLLELWEKHRLDAIVITSSEGLRNFADMLGGLGRGLLESTPLFVPHSRIVSLARSLGLSRVVQTAPGDDGIMTGLVDYFSALDIDPTERPGQGTQGASSHHGS